MRYLEDNTDVEPDMPNTRITNTKISKKISFPQPPPSIIRNNNPIVNDNYQQYYQQPISMLDLLNEPNDIQYSNDDINLITKDDKLDIIIRMVKS